MFCVQCGSAIPAEDKFCRSCGAPVYRAAGSAPEVQLASAVPVPQGAVQTRRFIRRARVHLPGRRSQQPVYYVVQQPAAHTHTLQQMNLLRSLQGQDSEPGFHGKAGRVQPEGDVFRRLQEAQRRAGGRIPARGQREDDAPDRSWSKPAGPSHGFSSACWPP